MITISDIRYPCFLALTMCQGPLCVISYALFGEHSREAGMGIIHSNVEILCWDFAAQHRSHACAV